MEQVLKESKLEKECRQGMWFCGSASAQYVQDPVSNPGTTIHTYIHTYMNGM